MLTTNLFGKLIKIQGASSADGAKVKMLVHPMLGTLAERTIKEDGKPDRVDSVGWCPLVMVVFNENKVSWNWYNSQTRKNVRRELELKKMAIRNTSMGTALHFVAGTEEFSMVITQVDDLWEMKLNAIVNSFNSKEPAEEVKQVEAQKPATAPKKSRAKKQIATVETQKQEIEAALQETADIPY
jgi:hypothetical protein